jgi:hypothetical protein
MLRPRLLTPHRPARAYGGGIAVPVGGALSSAPLVTRIRSIGYPSANSLQNTVTRASAALTLTSKSPVCASPSNPRKLTVTYRRLVAANGQPPVQVE